jgi:hypothetical protein
MLQTLFMNSRAAIFVACCLLLAGCFAAAKDKKEKDKSESAMVLVWPDQSTPAIKLTFGKFTQAASYNGQLSLESHVLVENVSGKKIPQASFTVYLLDTVRVRIGSGSLSFSDLDAGQQARLSFQVMSLGLPATLSLVAHTDANGIPTSLKTTPLKVISVPSGAILKVDGHDVGSTPATVRLTVGNHLLGFSKEGYASGTTPVEIKPDDAPGGSITFELGGLSRDNVELRNGTVLQGDVLSVTMTSIVVRVDGKDQTYDRNQVEKIVLVQRQIVEQPTVVQSSPAQPTPSQPSSTEPK